MISCILPTRGRRQLAEQAVACFNSQTYEDKELIIVDDADQPSFPYGVEQENIRYHVNERAMLIPEKRNFCCQLSHGEWIAHFDSDDWSAPERLTAQMNLMAGRSEHVIGFHTVLFWDMDAQQAYKYSGNYFGNYAIGSSLLYLKRWWMGHEWQSTRTGLASDNEFVKVARRANELVSYDAGQLMVARVHAENSSHKTRLLHKQPYQPVDAGVLPVDFPR